MLLTPEQRTIAAQRTRIGELEEELRQWKEAAQPADMLPMEWKLEPAQRKLVLALAAAPGGLLSHESLFRTVSIFSTESRPSNVVAQQVHRARRRLKPFGIEIVSRWGFGFEMPQASRKVIKAALNRAEAAE